jgi:hypothetical protein
LVVLSVFVCCIHIKADVWPLVVTGDAIPGTPNFRFIGFSQPVINASGTVAFLGDFVDPATGLTGSGILKIAGGQVIPVMLEGQPLPDVAGRSFGAALYGPWINNNGDILFAAYTNEPVPPQVVIFPEFVAVFVESGGKLRRIADYNTPVPGAFGQTFVRFIENMQINDKGDILFSGQGESTAGTFLVSQGAIQLVSTGGSVSMNNRGDLLLGINSTLSIESGGSITPAVSFPLTVPGTNQTAIGGDSVTLNDDQSIVFIGTNTVFTGRFYDPYQNSVLRWGRGGLQKIVAAGDPVPGFNGATFAEDFMDAHSNPTSAIFMSRRQQVNVNPFGVLTRADQNGQLSVLASEDQFVDGIGTLDLIASPNLDTQQGNLVTFLAGAAAGSETGIYAATAAPQFTLRFPQIADGGGGAVGGWRTSIILANRSATAANATISFFNNDGTPLSLAVGGSQQSQTSIVVPALGVAEVQTQGGEPSTVAGWAQVQSDQNLTGSAIFGLLDGSGNSVTEVGVPSSLALNSMSVFAQNGATTSTGIALANPNSVGATVTLTLKDSNSTQLAQTSVTIAGMGHLSRYANELFPSIPPGEFQGKIEVLSTLPLVGLTLRQRGSVFTSLPVIP